jgi:hypothetical protein
MYYIVQSNLGDLLDVTITEPVTQYQHLEYTGSQWVNVSRVTDDARQLDV